MRTRQKCVATDTWRSLGCRTTPLEHWSRRKPTVEPRWAKQQTKKLRPKPTKINSFMSWPWSKYLFCCFTYILECVRVLLQYIQNDWRTMHQTSTLLDNTLFIFLFFFLSHAPKQNNRQFYLTSLLFWNNPTRGEYSICSFQKSSRFIALHIRNIELYIRNKGGSKTKFLLYHAPKIIIASYHTNFKETILSNFISSPQPLGSSVSL